MPNPEAIRKAAERRAARASSRANTAEKLAAETAKVSTVTELQNAAQTDPEAARELEQVHPTPKPKPVVGKKARQLESRKAAEAQAEADVRVVSRIPDEDLELSQYAARGEEPPLHVLNRIAQINDRAIRDDARELARAVGQVAYEQASNRDSRGRHAREKRMHAAIAAARAKPSE